MDIDLFGIYTQISHKKKRNKLHIENCTAEQIFYQIKELTDSVIERAESLLSKMHHCSTEDDHQSSYQGSCNDNEVEDSGIVFEDDILDCPKKFFDKMDENVGTVGNSDEITSDYLADLDANLEKPKSYEHK